MRTSERDLRANVDAATRRPAGGGAPGCGRGWSRRGGTPRGARRRASSSCTAGHRIDCGYVCRRRRATASPSRQAIDSHQAQEAASASLMPVWLHHECSESSSYAISFASPVASSRPRRRARTVLQQRNRGCASRHSRQARWRGCPRCREKQGRRQRAAAMERCALVPGRASHGRFLSATPRRGAREGLVLCGPRAARRAAHQGLARGGGPPGNTPL